MWWLRCANLNARISNNHLPQIEDSARIQRMCHREQDKWHAWVHTRGFIGIYIFSWETRVLNGFPLEMFVNRAKLSGKTLGIKSSSFDGQEKKRTQLKISTLKIDCVNLWLKCLRFFKPDFVNGEQWSMWKNTIYVLLFDYIIKKFQLNTENN